LNEVIRAANRVEDETAGARNTALRQEMVGPTTGLGPGHQDEQ
jgi:hypothetical protein